MILQVDQLSFFAQALAETDFADILAGSDQYTVFAPSNDAWAEAETALSANSSHLLNSTKLPAVLLFHIVPGNGGVCAVTTAFFMSQVTSQVVSK